MSSVLIALVGLGVCVAVALSAQRSLRGVVPQRPASLVCTLSPSCVRQWTSTGASSRAHNSSSETRREGRSKESTPTAYSSLPTSSTRSPGRSRRSRADRRCAAVIYTLGRLIGWTASQPHAMDNSLTPTASARARSTARRSSRHSRGNSNWSSLGSALTSMCGRSWLSLSVTRQFGV